MISGWGTQSGLTPTASLRGEVLIGGQQPLVYPQLQSPDPMAQEGLTLPPSDQPDHYERTEAPIITVKIESPCGGKRITGKFPVKRFTPPLLHRMVDGLLSDVGGPSDDDVGLTVLVDDRNARARELQNRENLEALTSLYGMTHIQSLKTGDDPIWIEAGIDMAKGTIICLEGVVIDHDRFDSAVYTYLKIRRSGKVLVVENADTKALRADEAKYTSSISFADWFDLMVGHGIPYKFDDPNQADPGKVRRRHNLTQLQRLHYTKLNFRQLDVREVDQAILAGLDWRSVTMIGDMPVGASLKLAAIVDLETGHIAEITYQKTEFIRGRRVVRPDTQFDEMRFGFALFEVDMRDKGRLIVDWTDASDLAGKDLNSVIVEEFRRQGNIVDPPDETSVVLAADNSLQVPAALVSRTTREPSRPKTAVSEVVQRPNDGDTLGDFAMEEASVVR